MLWEKNKVDDDRGRRGARLRRATSSSTGPPTRPARWSSPPARWRWRSPGSSSPTASSTPGAPGRCPTLPKTIAVVGAGASGAEIASAYVRYGTEVTLIEMLPQILPAEDKDIVRVVERVFKKQGIEVLTGNPITDVEAGVEVGQGEGRRRDDRGRVPGDRRRPRARHRGARARRGRGQARRRRQDRDRRVPADLEREGVRDRRPRPRPRARPQGSGGGRRRRRDDRRRADPPARHRTWSPARPSATRRSPASGSPSSRPRTPARTSRRARSSSAASARRRSTTTATAS